MQRFTYAQLLRGETFISVTATEVLPSNLILSCLWIHLRDVKASLHGAKVTSVYAAEGYDAIQIVTEIGRPTVTTISLSVEKHPFEVILMDEWLFQLCCTTCGK